MRTRKTIRGDRNAPRAHELSEVSGRTACSSQRITHVCLGVILSLSIAAVVSAGSAGATISHRVTVEPAPVASLEPAATARLWRRLVATRSHQPRVTADCRPLRSVFYAATDFLRLATKLAANGSPCAEYYISIPSIVGNRTQPRRDQAWRIRALGPNFHAMAEIQYGAWADWVESTSSSWYEAGTTARMRMADAGYDVSEGDIWMVNEASSAVRRGTGHARANLRELLRGLWEGDGTQLVRGSVLVIGVGQQTRDVSLYQTNLQSWLSDSDFWIDIATYVSDWSQEVFGDVRNWAVPDVSTSIRRDHLNDYLQHEFVLAGAGMPTTATAGSYLQSGFSPLANAAWEHESGYGWTMVPMEQMAGYVSAQIDALRSFSVTTGQAQDHWGFAWAPRNLTGANASDFANKTGYILDRIASAVRDSGQTGGSESPGSAACGPQGQNLWCVGDLEDARLNEAWKSFRVWTQSALTFTTPPQTIQAGTPSAAMTLSLVTSSGAQAVTTTPLTVTLGSSSPQGTFSTTPTGPWSTTLPLTIAAGSGTTGTFYYLDARAGTPVLTASAEDVTSGTQTETVTPGPVVSLTVVSGSATVRARASRRFEAEGTDSYGNTFPVTAAWWLSPPAIGSLAPTRGTTTTFTAARTLGDATVTVAVDTPTGPLSTAVAVQVTPGRLRIESITYRRAESRTAYVTVTARDATGRSISRAHILILVRRDGRLHYVARAATGAAGKTVFRVPMRKGGCFTIVIRHASAGGFTWDGRTAPNSFCTPRPTG